MTSLRVLLHVAAQRDYELHSLDFSTAFLQGSLHEEIWQRRLPGFTGSFLAGTQWSLRRPIYSLREAPHEWHDTLRTTLAALGLAPSTADPSLFLRTDTSLPPFYFLVYVLQRFGFRYSSPQSTPLPTGHSLSAPPFDESVGPSAPILARYVALRRHRPEHCEAPKRVLHYLCITSGMGLVLGGRGPFVLTGHADASWVEDLATRRSSQSYTFSLGFGSVSWRCTRSSSVLSSKQPRSSPVLYVDNKAMIALCQEHRLEHRTKHIALHYFLAREFQQRFQLRLAYVATRANTSDIFTKALQSGDHQRFCTVLGLFPPHSTAPLVALPCPARRAALLAACCPAVPVAPPCRPSAALPCPSSRPASRAPPCPACRAALPYQTHRPAGSTPPSPARRFALLATVSPCPARAPPCCPPRRPAAHRAALPYPRAALLAAAPSCPSRALPYWPPPCPANCAALPWPRAALP
ncbi:unnamed protein product [Closterium sp. NIES-53]